MLGGDGEGLAEPAGARGFDNVLASEGQKILRVAFVHDGRMRSDAGLERETDQQRLTEGMDGLDVEAARRVQHAGEELASPAALIIGRLSAEQVEELCVKSARHRQVAQSPSRSAIRLAISAAAALV